MPTGFQSGQEGNALPLSGEAEIRLASSGTDALTITGHSSMSTAADFLVLRTWVPEGTTGPASEKFVIGSSGQLRQFKYFVTAHSTALDGNTTAITLGASQSGSIHTVGGYSSGVQVRLPAPNPGLNYTVIVAPAMASLVSVSATAAGDFDVIAPFRGSGLSTASVVSPPTTVAGMGAMFLAISTARWQLFPIINGIQGASAAAEITGCWIAGTS